MKNKIGRMVALGTTAMIFFGLAGVAQAKSLYLIADINSSPTPINTYDIEAAPAYVVFQATQGVPDLAGGAVGLAIDTDSKKLAVTYEGSDTIQLLDATNFADLGTATAAGASNLAGIVFDQGKKKLYTVDRQTNHLYVYSWAAATNTLTLDGGTFIALPNVSAAHGLALDESRGRLFVGDADSTTVRYFDTTTWTEAGNFVQALSGQTVMGIAVDTVRNIVYTGNAYQPYGSLGELVKYNLNTNTETFYTLPGAQPSNSGGDNIVGVAVDEETGNVYTTTGNQGSGGTDTLIVFDSALNVLKNDLGDIGSPTGIVVPRAGISYNPLNFSKTADVNPVPTGDNLTYSLCFDNLANAETALTNVVITDAVPEGTSFVSATGGPATSGSTLTWTVANVAAGAAQSCFNMVVNVTAADGSVIHNSAAIKSDQTPPTTQTLDTGVTAPSSRPINVSGTGKGGAATPLDLLVGLGVLGVALARRRGMRMQALALLAALAVAALVPAGSTAYAADSGFYAGAGAGMSIGNFSAAELDRGMAARGFQTHSTLDDKDVGWKLFGGFQFNKYVAAEASYVDLGNIKSNIHGSVNPSSSGAFLQAVAAVHPYSVSGFALSAVGLLPVWNRFSLVGRLGLMRWSGEANAGAPSGASISHHDNGTDLTFGAGVDYRLSDCIGIALGWDRYYTNRNHPDLFAFTAAYHF